VDGRQRELAHLGGLVALVSPTIKTPQNSHPPAIDWRTREAYLTACTEADMRRRDVIGGLLAIAFGRPSDLSACGDKFLRVGRSARFSRYAAVHPAGILIYPPVNSTRAGIADLKASLKRAGHKPVVLDRTANVAAALTASAYDVVIADYLDTERLKGDLQSAASKAALLPILNHSSKDVESAASRQYPFLIKPHAMTRYDALAEVDRLMESRRRTGAAGAE
jgi:hypothetical protein